MRPAILAAAIAACVPLAGSLAPPPRHLRPARRRCGPLGRAGRTRLSVLGTDEEALKEAKADKYKQALMLSLIHISEPTRPY